MTSPEELEIRAATAHDTPLLLELIRELAAFVNQADKVQTDEPRLGEHLFGSCATASAWLAFVSDDAVGYAVTFPTFSTFLGRPGVYLEDLFIRDRFRQRGYGRTFFRFLAREANRRGCPRFEWTVLAWNNAAIQLYESFGAVVLPDTRTCRLAGKALVSLGA